MGRGYLVFVARLWKTLRARVLAALDWGKRLPWMFHRCWLVLERGFSFWDLAGNEALSCTLPGCLIPARLDDQWYCIRTPWGVPHTQSCTSHS